MTTTAEQLTAEERAAVMTDLTTFELQGDLEVLASTMVYQGFDHAIVYNGLRSHEQDRKIFMTEMTKLILFFTIRGTRTEKQLKRTASATKEEIKALAAKYKIVEKSAANLARYEASPGRVLQCFPKQVSAIMDKGLGRDLGEEDKVLARKYRFFGAPAIMTETTEMIAWVAWAVAADKRVNGNKADKAKLLQFANIARSNSPFLSGPEKQEVIA